MKVTRNYKGYTLSGVTLSTPKVLNVNYYDDYAFIGTNGIDSGITAYDALTGFNTRYTTSAKTFLTGTLTAQLLPNGTVSSTYLYAVMYYDYRGRVIQAKGNNHLSGGTEKEYIAYDFMGQPLQKKHIHAATGKTTQTELYTYAYDEAERLKTTKYSLNGGATVTLASNTYDELGRLKTTTRNGLAALATTYTYNVRSWLKSSASPLFNQTLYYNDTYGGSTARYNGNIAAMSWKMSNETPTRGYKFTYDNLSRLTAAGYLENGSANSHFNTSYAYDKQGNMTALTRGGNTGTSTYGTIDNLAMTYTGNQLIKAEDSGASVSLSASMDFKNNSNAAREYFYDVNGNLTKDLNKGISGISYNLLNLPRTLSISNSSGSATNNYTYAADGRKLESAIGSKTTDYCGNVIYENGALKRILIEGGYIEGGTYYFYLTDHLGNNRVVANSSGRIVQSTHYYPFGMSFAKGTITSSQPYKYNGKELDTDRGLNLYDYGARLYDPAIGRFTTVDPSAESYYDSGAYSYVGNSPIMRIDPTGADWYEKTNGNLYWQEGNSDINGYNRIGSSVSIQLGKDSYLNAYQNAGIIANKAVNAFNLINSSKKLQNQFLGKDSPLSENSKSQLFNAITSRSMDRIARPIGEAIVEYGAAELVGPWVGKAFGRLVGRISGKSTTTAIKQAGNKLPTQIHHFATNKNSVWTSKMADIAKQYGLNLNESWNKATMPHLGRHPNAYHNFVYQNMQRAATEAGGNQTKFLQLFDQYVKQPILQNPELLRKSGW